MSQPGQIIRLSLSQINSICKQAWKIGKKNYTALFVMIIISTGGVQILGKAGVASTLFSAGFSFVIFVGQMASIQAAVNKNRASKIDDLAFGLKNLPIIQRLFPLFGVSFIISVVPVIFAFIYVFSSGDAESLKTNPPLMLTVGSVALAGILGKIFQLAYVLALFRHVQTFRALKMATQAWFINSMIYVPIFIILATPLVLPILLFPIANPALADLRSIAILFASIFTQPFILVAEYLSFKQLFIFEEPEILLLDQTKTAVTAVTPEQSR